MRVSPIRSLVYLTLIGIAISGWLYGIHWKRVASGDKFTNDEKLLIQLQDQIRTLEEYSMGLSARLDQQKALKGETVEEPKATPVAPADPGVLAPFEKVELPRKGL